MFKSFLNKCNKFLKNLKTKTKKFAKKKFAKNIVRIIIEILLKLSAKLRRTNLLKVLNLEKHLLKIRDKLCTRTLLKI